MHIFYINGEILEVNINIHITFTNFANLLQVNIINIK